MPSFPCPALQEAEALLRFDDPMAEAAHIVALHRTLKGHCEDVGVPVGCLLHCCTHSYVPHRHMAARVHTARVPGCPAGRPWKAYTLYRMPLLQVGSGSAPSASGRAGNDTAATEDRPEKGEMTPSRATCMHTSVAL